MDFYLDASIGNRCSMDCFISPNQFFDWRNTKQLASLHANWLEIDINDHGGEALTAAEEAEVVSEVFHQIEKSGLPEPTGYVLSGSGGMHLYWIYEAAPAFRWRVNAWRDITNKLISNIKNGRLWHIDIGASRDPARVLRMPGTVHSKSERRVQAYLGGPSYTFENLAKLLNVCPEKPEHLKVVQTNVEIEESSHKNTSKREHKPAQKSSIASGKHTIGQWWFKIYTHILQHSRKNGVPEGRRDSTAYILFVALRHMKSEEKAYEWISQLNKELIGFDQATLDKYLKSARTTLYKYKKSSLASYLENQLGMDTSFLYQKNQIKMTPEQVKIAQKESSKTTANKKRQSTYNAIRGAAVRLIAEGKTLTQAAISDLCDRSVRTVRRYWAALLEEEVIRSRSIYSPPREVWPVSK